MKLIAILISIVVYTFANVPLGQNIAFKDYTKYDPHAKPSNGQLDLAAVEAFLTKAQECRNLPGLGVGIISNGSIVYTKGFGNRNVENNLPVTEDTLFNIGSTTKAMTNALGLLLLQNGDKHVFNRPVRDILPEFQTMDSFAQSRAVLVDLLTHRTGLPRHDLTWIMRGREKSQKPSMTRQEILAGLKYLQPTRDFRFLYQYNNLMIAAAGFAIAEEYRKMYNSTCTMENCYETMIQNLLFDKLGMSSSLPNNWYLNESSNYARGYICKENPDSTKCKTQQDFTPCPGVREHNALLDLAPITPAGAVLSTPKEMAKWISSLLTPVDGFLSQRSIDIMFSGIVPMGYDMMYALGWIVTRYRNLRIVQHDGAVMGSITQVSLFPDTKDGYVLMINHNNAFETLQGIGVYLNDAVTGLSPTISIEELCAMDLPTPPRPELPEIVQSVTPLGFEGNYSNPIYGTFAVYQVVEEGKIKYKVIWNDVATTWLRLDTASNTYAAIFDFTFSGLSILAMQFERKLGTISKHDRVKVVMQDGVEPIVFVTSDFVEQGFGMNLGFGGNGLNFPAQHVQQPNTPCKEPKADDSWILIRTLTISNISVTIITCLLAIITTLLVTFLVAKRSKYQTLQ